MGVSDPGPDAEDIYEIHNSHTRIAEYVAARDARLIAAAPTMYEALRAMLDHHTGLGHSPAVQLARAALAMVSDDQKAG
jgi:hypothetical protein